MAYSAEDWSLTFALVVVNKRPVSVNFLRAGTKFSASKNSSPSFAFATVGLWFDSVAAEGLLSK